MPYPKCELCDSAFVPVFHDFICERCVNHGKTPKDNSRPMASELPSQETDGGKGQDFYPFQATTPATNALDAGRSGLAA